MLYLLSIKLAGFSNNLLGEEVSRFLLFINFRLPTVCPKNLIQLIFFVNIDLIEVASQLASHSFNGK